MRKIVNEEVKRGLEAANFILEMLLRGRREYEDYIYRYDTFGYNDKGFNKDVWNEITVLRSRIDKLREAIPGELSDIEEGEHEENR